MCIGHISYKGRIVKENAHEAIVDEDDFWFAYYRFAETDLEGNPIEHPDGVTKRYQQKRGASSEALFAGLRMDGTPVLTTNMSDRAGVYVKYDPPLVNYAVVDRSQVAVYHHVARIKVGKLDAIFSERLHYRVGEALKNTGENPVDEEGTEVLESRRREIHTQLIATLEDAEEMEHERSDPLAALRNSIAETHKKIAEKERVSEVATHVMDTVDLRKHFESLKKLRRSLTEMKRKLERAGIEESEREGAMGKFPEVYERWPQMALESKQRFIRVATSRVSLDEMMLCVYRIMFSKPARNILTLGEK